MGRSCRSQRIRRPQRVRLVFVAQFLLGGVPKLFLAAFGPAGLLPQAMRAFSDLLLGRLGQLHLLLWKHGPTLGVTGGLEAGPCRPAIGGDAGPRSQASTMCKSSCASASREPMSFWPPSPRESHRHHTGPVEGARNSLARRTRQGRSSARSLGAYEELRIRTDTLEPAQ
jgi:hypothetical protein